MLLRNVFTKSIWDARRSLPGWTVAIAGVGLMYAAFWPTMRSPEMATSAGKLRCAVTTVPPATTRSVMRAA